MPSLNNNNEKQKIHTLVLCLHFFCSSIATLQSHCPQAKPPHPQGNTGISKVILKKEKAEIQPHCTAITHTVLCSLAAATLKLTRELMTLL